MQNQNQVKNSLSWRPASKFIEFAFEEGGLRPFGREDDQDQNLENGSPRKLPKPDEQEQEDGENSYEPSNEVIDFQKVGVNNQPMEILVTGNQVVDQVSHTCVFVSKACLPTITVSTPESAKGESEDQSGAEKSKFVELFLAQKSHSSEYQKYKIIRGGIKGGIREKIKGENIKFEKIKFNYLSNPQKLPRLILVLYEQNESRRIYKSVMISDEFSVIDNHKVLTIENNEQLKLYFEPIQTHFLDKTGLQIAKINLLNKHKIVEEMSTFQNYLIKKNKKIWNIVYAAYKYSHIIDLYFLNAEGKSKKDQFLELWKEVVDSFRAGESQEGEKTCNYLHPSAKFVLKIHSQMRNVRFIISKELTKHLSIVASDTEFDASGKWTKFDTISELKDAFVVCQTEIQAKIISEPIIAKTSVNIVNPVQQSSPPVEPPKKPSVHHNSKNDDDDFNEEDIEDEDDDVEYEGESSQNYSVSNRKRGRKLGQKKTQDPKKQGNIAYRENKYATRGGNRTTRNKEETEDSNDKRANIAKKNKEKQAFNRTAIQAPLAGTPPFRVLTPAQAGQYKDQQTQSIQGKMIGLIPMMNPGAPMMMGGKKPEDPKSQPTVIPKGVMPVMMPAGMTPQMMAMMGGGMQGGMGGMQVMPMGNGMHAVMMPAQMDKGGQGGQPNIPGMSAMAMGGLGGMGGMAGMAGMGGMGGMGGMMPFMMGGGSGMPQGFMMPMMQQPQSQGQGQQSSDKSKQTDSEKQKHQGQKKDQKKDHFPPQQMPSIDFSKMGMMGQMPAGVTMMPGGQMGGMQMPQMMQMGMPGMGGMMAGGSMPQGIMMNPMMAMQKPSGDGKEEGSGKQQGSMPNPMMGGGMPFMMAQVPSQMQGQDPNSQNPSAMQMGMMSQFPTMVQMPQQSQMQGNPSQGGMPMGYTMMVNPEQGRSMTPNQMQQQLQLQMQMMMSKGMMPMMQMPKNDQNDPSKK